MGLFVKIGFTHFFSFFSAEQVHRAMDRGMRSEGNLHDVTKTSATALYTAVLRTQPWCSHAHRRQVRDAGSNLLRGIKAMVPQRSAITPDHERHKVPKPLSRW